MASESFFTFLGYLVAPVFVVVGLTILIHLILTLVRNRIIDSGYEDVESNTSVLERGWAFLRRGTVGSLSSLLTATSRRPSRLRSPGPLSPLLGPISEHLLDIP